MNNKGGRSNFKKRKFSSERKENPPKTHINNRVPTARRPNIEEKNSKETSNETNEFFGSPDKYFTSYHREKNKYIWYEW